MKNILKETFNEIEKKTEEALFAGWKVREEKVCCDKCHSVVNNEKCEDSYIKGYEDSYYLLNGEFLCEKCFTKKLLCEYKLFTACVVLFTLMYTPFWVISTPFRRAWIFIKRIPRKLNQLIENVFYGISSYAWKTHMKIFRKSTDLFNEYLEELDDNIYKKYLRCERYSDITYCISDFFWKAKHERFQKEMDNSLYEDWKWKLDFGGMKHLL